MTGRCSTYFEKHKPWKIVGMVIGGILLAGLLAFLLGWVVMLLWNWLMPAIFGLGTITYWQGFGIFFLAKLLFGFGGDHSSESSSKKKEKKGTIRGEIGDGIKDEIKREFRKEFRKEFQKEYEKENGHIFNEDYDDKYESWWTSEGKAAFEEYMSKKPEEKESGETEA